jgi:predicted DNA-binding helix-hairpin-helix protein
VLLTNFCVYDCAFCVNRLSSDTPRARFKVEEIVALTLGFYRRNMIEGLFLSSGIAKSEDHTTEETVRVAETLRRDHDFRGYIHLKAIAGASQDLMERAGWVADRLSVNVELPVDVALVRLAPQKDVQVIRKAMGGLRLPLDETKEEKRKTPRAPRFAPAGQSTQMIIGADEARDRDTLRIDDLVPLVCSLDSSTPFRRHAGLAADRPHRVRFARRQACGSRVAPARSFRVSGGRVP